MIESMKLYQLISEEKIQNRIKEMGEEITKKYQDSELIVLGVLKGSFMFYSDLVRAINLDLKCDFLGVSSYVGAKSSGECKLTLDAGMSLKDQHVLVVEDIVDTGLTMNFLKQHLSQRGAKSLTTASLLLKPDALKVECPIDYVGFEIANDFVVGYGLDYQGMYRNMPYIAQVQNMN
jgi:hypoxanthine phosphoribosyltransferase